LLIVFTLGTNNKKNCRDSKKNNKIKEYIFFARFFKR
jgi:hypothetical protein